MNLGVGHTIPPFPQVAILGVSLWLFGFREALWRYHTSGGFLLSKPTVIPLSDQDNVPKPGGGVRCGMPNC